MPVITGIIFFFLFCLPFSADQDSTQATQLIKAFNGMRENEFFITSLNPTIANIGKDIDRIHFKRIIQHHIESNILYLQFDLGKSYREVRHTQELLIKLYDSLLERNANSIDEDLTFLGKPAIQTGNKTSMHYLQLGLRDLAVAKQKMMYARNTRPYLFLVKLKEYSDALKLLKHAQKYIVLLGLAHDSDYNPMIEKLDFDTIKGEIDNAISKKRFKYNTLHHDANFKIYTGKNYFKDYWDKPDLHELSAPIENFDALYERNPKIPGK